MAYIEKWRYYKRKWLNLKSGRAFSIACVGGAKEDIFKEPKGKKEHYHYGTYVESYLHLGDCSQDVSLDFSFSADDEKDFAKQISKLDRLLATMVKMRAAMVESKKHVATEHAKYKKYAKKVDDKNVRR